MTRPGANMAPFIETVAIVSEETLQTMEQGGYAAQQLEMDFCARLFLAMERGVQQALSELRQLDPANIILLEKPEEVSANNNFTHVLAMPDVVMSRSFNSNPLMDCHVAFGKTIGPFLRAVRTMTELVDRRRLYVLPAIFEWSCDGSGAGEIEPYCFTIVFCRGPRLVLESDCD